MSKSNRIRLFKSSITTKLISGEVLVKLDSIYRCSVLSDRFIVHSTTDVIYTLSEMEQYFIECSDEYRKFKGFLSVTSQLNKNVPIKVFDHVIKHFSNVEFLYNKISMFGVVVNREANASACLNYLKQYFNDKD